MKSFFGALGALSCIAAAALAAAPAGTTLVQDAGKIQGVAVRKPKASDHNKVLAYDNNSGAFKLRAVNGVGEPLARTRAR